MKFLFIKDNESGFKEYNISKTFIVCCSFLFFAFSMFFGYKISDLIQTKKNKELYELTILKAKNDIQYIKEEQKIIFNKDNDLRSMSGLPLIPEDVKRMGTGGELDSNDINYFFEEDLEDDIISFIDNVSHLKKVIELQKISYTEISNYIERNLNKILRTPAIHPIPIEQGEKTSGFGMRRDPYTRKYKMHEGQDFSGVWNRTPILATADGRVKNSKNYGTYGNYIEIDHGDGIVTIYAHLHRRYVKKGDRVKRGQKIGTLGNTGRSTAPHLHYEVKKFGKPINPEKYFFDKEVY